MTAPKFMAVICRSDTTPEMFTIPAGHRKILIWFTDGQPGQLVYDGVALNNPPNTPIAIGDGKEPLDALTFGFAASDGEQLNIILQ
jgi:hypothetical protein